MKKADFKRIAEKYGISPITARLIRNRDIVGDEEIRRFLEGNISDLYDPYLMKDGEKCARILKDKISAGSSIRIIGDYDIDGVNSVYILYKAITRCGGKADYDIPDRIRDGYGINCRMVEKAYEEGIDTIITCDNGISAFEAVDRAASLGMTILITDHHQVNIHDPEDAKMAKAIVIEDTNSDTDDVRYAVPGAHAIVNPHRPDCSYPYKELCGASVAWKLVKILYELCGIPGEEWENFIEYAAFATVGDVVDLTDENRIIVREGLKKFRNTSNCGYRALMTLNNLTGSIITPYHLGFVLGPCINAGGRLDTAIKALEMLLCTDRDKAVKLAQELKDLNDNRKNMTLEGVNKAVDMIESGSLDDVLVVYLPDCHESLAGIIAGRLRERYYRPAFVLTDCEGDEDDGKLYAKGSGRSVPGYSMFEELTACKNMLVKFGGHPMAAGLTVLKERIGELKEDLNRNASLSEDDKVPAVTIDMELPFYYATEELARELELIEPCGKGCRKPLFALRDVKVESLRVLGKNRNAVKMMLRDKYNSSLEAMYFIPEEELDIAAGDTISITYYPEINEFRGMVSVQGKVCNVRKQS